MTAVPSSMNAQLRSGDEVLAPHRLTQRRAMSAISSDHDALAHSSTAASPPHKRLAMLPRFGSPAVYAARLLDNNADHWSIRPSSPFTVTHG